MHACPSGTSRTRQVAAAVIGNALEWYDFIVYGFLSSLIARLFFPSGDEYTSLLMALATFGVGSSCVRSVGSCSACMPTAGDARRRCN
ncbi:Proline/betaine transporter [Acinetobacter baumannii]|nr:Proline/betaine transporter [Acinetobacter baumannii]